MKKLSLAALALAVAAFAAPALAQNIAIVNGKAVPKARLDMLVQQAERFSIQLPLVGRVAVPSPKQLAFYGALGALAVFEVIDWPVAVAVGVGQAAATSDGCQQTRSGSIGGRPMSTRSIRPHRGAASRCALR